MWPDFFLALIIAIKILDLTQVVLISDPNQSMLISKAN